MIETLLSLIVLFFVIFDPPMSLSVFTTATSNLEQKERNVIAQIAILVAGTLSLLVLLLGENLLFLFNTNIDEFKIAGGIILGILGVKMVLGESITDTSNLKNNSSRGIAAIIGTPLLTGPAAITAIMVSSVDYGRFLTGLAVLIVLIITGIIFLFSNFFNRILGKTAIQILTTILGMINICWGVNFIASGIKAIFLI